MNTLKKNQKKQKALPPLTSDLLRTYPGLQDLTDEQAEESLRTLQELAAIAFSIFNNVSHE
ncbi:hypothetical protein [uncultured Pontibacter sp.]|uniref:hypothetical protein n=1 Tax=uncultured Pontibacter sp. TaxID=453356 RepID=UPI00261D7107|nr:hypothetical protein [uncultured Pontibacter sp.]